MAVIVNAHVLRISLALLPVLLVGCASQIEAPKPDKADTATPASSSSEVPTRSEALLRLIGQAQAAYQAGSYQRTIDLAERGLRMDRYAPELYLLLAQGYYGLDLPAQAVSFARLGLRYVSARPELKPALQALAEPD